MKSSTKKWLIIGGSCLILCGAIGATLAFVIPLISFSNNVINNLPPNNPNYFINKTNFAIKNDYSLDSNASSQSIDPIILENQNNDLKINDESLFNSYCYQTLVKNTYDYVNVLSLNIDSSLGWKNNNINVNFNESTFSSINTSILDKIDYVVINAISDFTNFNLNANSFMKFNNLIGLGFFNKTSKFSETFNEMIHIEKNAIPLSVQELVFQPNFNMFRNKNSIKYQGLFAQYDQLINFNAWIRIDDYYKKGNLFSFSPANNIDGLSNNFDINDLSTYVSFYKTRLYSIPDNFFKGTINLQNMKVFGFNNFLVTDDKLAFPYDSGFNFFRIMLNIKNDTFLNSSQKFLDYQDEYFMDTNIISYENFIFNMFYSKI